MWFTFVTARLFIFLGFQPRLAATLLRLCSAVNSPTRRVGLAPTFKPASLAQPSLFPVELLAGHGHFEPDFSRSYPLLLASPSESLPILSLHTP